MFPEVESAWAQVQGLFLGVIVPGVVALFVAVLTIVMAFRWLRKAGRYLDTDFDDVDGNDYWDDDHGSGMWSDVEHEEFDPHDHLGWDGTGKDPWSM